MGINERLVVVSDAGPLLHLDELACLDLLEDFEEVLIPKTVWNEVHRHRGRLMLDQIPGAILATSNGLPSPQLQSLASALGLAAGEQEALSILQERSAKMLLCDDAAARLAAESIGFEVRGTLGLIVRSIRQGRRTREAVLRLLNELPARSTLHVSKPLLASVIVAVEQPG
jgi:predicted nucleic acid-binding protein